jgi:hypothetical protein
LGYEFLRYHLKVDFTNLVPVTDEARSEEQQAQEELSRRIRQRKYEKAAVEIEEMSDDIQDNVQKMVPVFSYARLLCLCTVGEKSGVGRWCILINDCIILFRECVRVRASIFWFRSWMTRMH